MPAATRRRYLIAYDIENDKNRQRLASLLLDYGDRMQLSVFEADLDDRDLQKIAHFASEVIRADNDSVRIYPLCRSCRSGVLLHGRKDPIETTYKII